MTGFGAASGEVEGVHYAVEVKSVNNRYLKVVLRLPDSLSALEGDIEAQMRQRIARGSVTLSVRMKLADEQAAYRVNDAVLQSYLEQIRLAETDSNPMLRLDLGAVLQLPGVCEPPPLEELAEQTRDGLLDLVDQAIDALVSMRVRDGKGTEDDLLVQCETIDRELQDVASRSGEVVDLYHERLRERVEELTRNAKVNIDAETLAREVAIFAERSDINEEISRLTAHVEQFREACRDGEQIGRKLDFIAQEMLREANTIASKASDASIARSVVDIKTAIDRIKEQAANVE
ncbi:MAG: YicC family protein [Planctomycetes bacterium]|nr:YicC family protein [Planctomycetota bacterium]